jgi:hypothetical protein
MSGNDLVRVWKDPDERGDAAHPAGEIALDELNGALSRMPIDQSFWWPRCNESFWFICPEPPLL